MIVMREKLGLSKPRNSGFDRGNLSLRSVNLERSDCWLEIQDLSVYWTFAVDVGGEGEAERSASNSPSPRVKRRGSGWMSGATEFSIGGGLELVSRA